MLTRNKPQSYAVASQEDRCADRSAVTIPSSLRPSGGRGFATTVLDLSLAGFSAACPDRMLVGTVCWLTLPGLEALQAEVVWWDNARVGCAFARLMSPIVHDNIVLRFRSGASVRGPSFRRKLPC
jgi:hypothetical protein